MDVSRPSDTLLAVWAHPDDEAYLAAGLLARTAAAGGRVVSCYATWGEAGTADPVAWPPQLLAVLRAQELATALSAAGAPEHVVMGYPDGGCDDVDAGDAADRLAGLIRHVRPTRIVTFGPDGITGHPDHVAVSRWTAEAWRRAAAAGVESDLLFATMTTAFLDRHRELHDRIGLFDAFGTEAAGVDPGDVALAVELDEHELDRKRRVLAAHRSQTDALARTVGEEAFRRWWSVESFRRPTPAELAAGTGDRRRRAA